MNKTLGVILIAAGVYICALGSARRDSIAGSVQSATATVADKVTGRTHVTEATWYYIAGGIIILAGVANLGRKN